MGQHSRSASRQGRAKPAVLGGRARQQASGHHLLRKWLLQGSVRSQDRGIALPIAVVAGLVLVIGVVALSSRASQGFIASLFQGENRDARDVAESAISDFGVTMNREENRFLLVAGNDSTWTDIKHRNICTASTQAADGTWSTVTSDLDDARDASAPVSASRFTKGDTWQPLIAGDTARSFKVTKIEYFFEKDLVDADSGETSRNRALFDFGTESTSFPGKTVREAALEGGTRTLLRVTVVGRVVRNGQTSYARVAREFEVVPKCCKRSFGNNIGAIPWGRDNAPCPVAKDTGVGNGVIGSLDGGAPSGSNNELDIRDEDNELITQALCWSGNKSGEASDLDGTPNSDCIDGDQRLGKASKNKSSVSFLPTQFSLKLPDPKWTLGGRLAPQSGTPLTVAALNTQFPTASFGTWISDGTNWWMRLFDADWKAFGSSTARPWSSYRLGNYSRICSSNRIGVTTASPHGLSIGSGLYLYALSGSLPSGGSYLSQVGPPNANTICIVNTNNWSGTLLWMSKGSTPVEHRSFLNCASTATDISMCRWEPTREVSPWVGPGSPSQTFAPYPQVDASAPDATILAPGNTNFIGRRSPSYSSETRIYLDPNTMIMMEKVGSAAATPMTNCVVSKDPAAPYAVADCRFGQISSGNNDVFIDTSYAMINFHFDDLSVEDDDEFMGGGGRTSYKRVHCSRATWTAACNDLVTWADFQIKCDTVAGSDPNCAAGKNSFYDHSELFNAFTLATGTFLLNGTSSTVGMNVYAPFATVEMKGGGNADPNFMGRVWANNIALNGNVKLRVPNSQPSFCSNTICPPPAQVPLFDVVARSFSHASGF